MIRQVIIPFLLRVLHRHLGASEQHIFEMLKRDCQAGGNGWQIQSLAPVQSRSWNSNRHDSTHVYALAHDHNHESYLPNMGMIRFISESKREFPPPKKCSPMRFRKRKASPAASADPIEIAGASSAPT